jgi:TonB-dependent receptor
MLVGTSMGAATDINGKYLIQNVPAGTYTIKASYVGYEGKESVITAKAGENIRMDFKLEPVGVKGKEVVVTAQASGQAQAINKELTSAQIVNAVSAAKIRELPDANAAESVGRLPGVFVLRSGGEGYKVVIRGLSPKYNVVTIDGIKMGSSDPNDRSTDLSMISPYMLEGIEVAKTVTPDMDADVIGGVVNFNMREAQVKETGVPEFNLLIQGGYNNLPDAYNRYNNYKYLGSIEHRVLDNRLGIFAQFDIERRNLTSDRLGVSYDHFGNSQTQYLITGVHLSDTPRDRLRYNGAFNLDYRLHDGTLKLINFASSQITKSQIRTESFDIGSNMLFLVFQVHAMS